MLWEVPLEARHVLEVSRFALHQLHHYMEILLQVLSGSKPINVCSLMECM